MDATIGDPRAASVEAAFERHPPPDFRELVTLRSIGISVGLGILFCFVGMRIQMTAGLVPALNMPVCILCYFLLKCSIKLLLSCGLTKLPFTRQENMFLLTSVMTCLNLAISCGYATNIIGMTSVVARTLSDDPPDPRDIVDYVPVGKWMFYHFLIGMTGILSTVPFNQVMIIDYKLLFPTGTVIAQVVNSFHTPEGAYVAKMQVATIFKVFFGSLSWSIFQWFYTSGNNCGFQSFPSFGFGLYKHRFYFDFSATYIGLGMICPRVVNLGLLFGATLSWGVIYPFLESKRGEWYQTESTSNLNGLNGYKVFISVTLIVTDGIINFLTLVTAAAINFYHVRKEQESGLSNYINKHPSLNYDDRKRIEMFLANRIPVSMPIAAYIACATIGMIVIPMMFNQIKLYHMAVLYMVIPILSFCNTYATGLTDWSVAPTYSKFATFLFAAWIIKPGAIIAALIANGVIMATLHISSQAMEDLKSGHMTMTSPRTMVTGQFFGVLLGAIISPIIYHAFQLTAKPNAPVGSKQSYFPCPFAGLYRAIAIIGTGGVKELPKHCITFCIIAFFVTVALDAIVLISQRKGQSVHKYIPNMTVIALPFFTGPFIAIDMCMGSLLLFAWTRMNSRSAELFSSSVAAGLICGEGLFTLPSALLNMFKVVPPICMKFLHGGQEVEVVDSFLKKLGTPTKKT